MRAKRKRMHGKRIRRSALKQKESRKGGLSWSTAIDQLQHGGVVDVWKDAKEKKAAKEQTKKDITARATQDVGAGNMRMI